MCFRKRDVRKIYKTTDGYFNNRIDIKKPRKVIALKQRKDKAIAVAKIYSKKEKSGSNYINNVILKPSNHKSLTEDSIVSNRIILGKKSNDIYIPIYPNDLSFENDKLTKKEYTEIMKRINADTKKHKKTRNKTIKKWKKRFK